MVENGNDVLWMQSLALGVLQKAPGSQILNQRPKLDHIQEKHIFVTPNRGISTTPS